MSCWDDTNGTPYGFPSINLPSNIPGGPTSEAYKAPTLIRPAGKLWIRKYRILVSKPGGTDDNGNAQEEEALNVSNLHCTFEIHKSRERGGMYAVARIYNLTADTENKLVMEGDRLIIEAGYEGQISTGEPETDEQGNQMTNPDGTAKIKTTDISYGKIFDGKIIWPSRSRESNVDYVLTLMAIDGDAPLNLSFISKTVDRGLNARKVVETVANDSEVKTPINAITEGLSEQIFPRGKVFFGRPYDYIEDVCRGNAASFYVEDGNLNVVKMTDPAKDEAVVLSPANGLIGTPQQIQFGVSFRTLLNPSLHLLSMVKLQNVQFNEMTATPGQAIQPMDPDWIYQIISLVHRGDTRGNDWYTECQAISRYGKGALPAILANSSQNGNGV